MALLDQNYGTDSHCFRCLR